MSAPPLKRYNLTVRQEVWDRLADVAKGEGTRVIDELRRAIKLWLLVRSGEARVVDSDGNGVVV